MNLKVAPQWRILAGITWTNYSWWTTWELGQREIVSHRRIQWDNSTIFVTLLPKIHNLNLIRRKQQTQMEGHSTKSLHYNLLKYQGHETQRQSKENQPRLQEGRRPWGHKCSKAGPSVIKATTGTAGKMGMGSKDGLGVCLFWWLYCGYIKSVFVCGKYIVKNLGVTASGWQVTLKKKFFVLETSIRLWLFQNKNYTKNLSSIVNAHH